MKIKNPKKTKFDIHNTIYREYTARNLNLKETEGRAILSLSKKSILILQLIIILFVLCLISKAFYLQIVNFQIYNDISNNNRFEKSSIVATRGNILDTNGIKLAWNVSGTANNSVNIRTYLGEAFGSMLGYVRYPILDKNGYPIRESIEGVSGAELAYNNRLTGINGSIVTEKNAVDELISTSHLEASAKGLDVKLTIDKNAQLAMFDAVKEVASSRGYKSGAGVLLDVNTGAILALVSYPNYDSNILSNSISAKKLKYLKTKNGVFLNRPVSGLFTPGSILKPLFGLAALQEELLTPNKIIISTGEITLPSKYDKNIIYTFKDWKAHGPINLYQAIAFSSNVYFYHLGGGYKMFKGLGIEKLNLYANIFGLTKETNLGIGNEPEGVFPNPKWKKNVFNEGWQIGDTYNAVIGQYVVQSTPLQIARGLNIIASGGKYVEPYLDKSMSVKNPKKIVLNDEYINVAKQGMRLAVTDGTLKAINYKDLKIAAKSGTAQIGADNSRVNALVGGFFPYENPKYTFMIVLENGPIGYSGLVATTFFKNLRKASPLYFTLD